jgi:hypothetical protein
MNGLKIEVSYINVIKGIINTKDFGLSKTYLTMSEEARYSSCVLVIQQALKTISMTDDIKIKKNYINNILERSIEYYVEIEWYEDALILSDLKEVLNNENT